MRERNEILLLRSLDDLVHGHKTLLHLVDHSLLALKRKLLIRLQLLPHIVELGLKVLPDLIFVLLPEFSFRLQFSGEILKQLLGIPVIIVILFKLDSLHSVPLFFRLVEDAQVLISVFLDLVQDVTLHALHHRLDSLALSAEVFVLSISLLPFQQHQVFQGAQVGIALGARSSALRFRALSIILRLVQAIQHPALLKNL